jgi:hypothetical protein
VFPLIRQQQNDSISVKRTFSDKYNMEKGRALAAKYFDKTGVRLSPSEALRLSQAP